MDTKYSGGGNAYGEEFRGVGWLLGIEQGRIPTPANDPNEKYLLPLDCLNQSSNSEEFRGVSWLLGIEQGRIPTPANDPNEKCLLPPDYLNRSSNSEKQHTAGSSSVQANSAYNSREHGGNMLGNLFREKTDQKAMADSIDEALVSMQDIVSRSSEAMNATLANHVPPQANNIHLLEIARQNPHHDISQELQGIFHEIYFEWIKSRSEIYSCIDSACSDLAFRSLVDVVTHEERVHGKISYGGYLCNVSGCQHSFRGNGFYGKAILMNHMKSAHKQVEQDSSTPSEEQLHMYTETRTITKVISKIKSFTEDFTNPSMDPAPNSGHEFKATGEVTLSQGMNQSMPAVPSSTIISATKKSLPVSNLTAPVDILFSHTEYQSHKVVPFITVRQLGHRSLGVVDAVRMESPESGSILLARKIIRVRTMD
jgi:hypothetical protein